MTPVNADEIIDRRRLRKKLGFWRVATFAVLALVLLGIIFSLAQNSIFGKTTSNHIAKVNITGVIYYDEPMLDLLKELAELDRVQGVILNISSPGGATVGGESIYEAVRKLGEKKPVVATVESLALSAGYMIASASDHIVAHRSSVVGSIGVLFQYMDASKLLETIGIKMNAVKSSPMKAEPSPFAPASEETTAMINRVIMDSYHWFVDIIIQRREMSRTRALELADGSIFTGGQGLANGLVDEIGGELTAREWLVTEKGLNKDIEIVDYTPERMQNFLLANQAAITQIGRIFGIELGSVETARLERLLLDQLPNGGLVSGMQELH